MLQHKAVGKKLSKSVDLGNLPCYSLLNWVKIVLRVFKQTFIESEFVGFSWLSVLREQEGPSSGLVPLTCRLQRTSHCLLLGF